MKRLRVFLWRSRNERVGQCCYCCCCPIRISSLPCLCHPPPCSGEFIRFGCSVFSPSGLAGCAARCGTCVCAQTNQPIVTMTNQRCRCSHGTCHSAVAGGKGGGVIWVCAIIRRHSTYGRGAKATFILGFSGEGTLLTMEQS